MIWPYFIPIIIVGTIQLIGIKNWKNSEKWLFIYAAVFLLLFAGTRANSSSDYTTYITYGRVIKTFQDVLYCPGFPMEMGYRFFSWIVNIFHLPVQFVILAMNAVSIGCVCKSITKHSCDVKLSLLLFLPFFFQYDMHAARTASAIGITTLAIDYILERKLLKFIGVTILASLFHKETIVIIPLYFIYNMNISTVTGCGILLVELLFVRVIGVGKLLIGVPSLLNLNSIAYKLDHYLYGDLSIFTYPTKIYDPRYIIALAIWIIAKNTIHSPSKEEKFLINASYFANVVMVFFGEYTFLFDRLSAFYTIYSIFLVPYIIKHSCSGEQKLGAAIMRFKYKALVVGFYIIYACAYALRLGSSQVYKFFEITFWS